MTKRRMYNKMAKYLIQIRFLDRHAKQYAKDLIFEISNKFKVRGVTRKRPVPHISLFGPFETRDPEKMVETVVSVCRKYIDLIEYKISGFGGFDNHLPEHKAIYLKIDGSHNLKDLRWDISRALMPFCKSQNKYDRDGKEKFNFHATLAFKDIDYKFKEILNYLKRKKRPQILQTVIRITIIRNGRIFKEFDLLQRWLLNQDQAKGKKAEDKRILPKSWGIIQQMKEPTPTNFHDFSNKKVFFISDTHFDHANIIRYTKRPFRNVEEMNNVLVQNWNNRVKEGDIVFFLGDLGFDRGHRPISYWTDKLNGKIYLLRGNHDKDKSVGKATEIPNVYPLLYKGHKFLLMHDPHRPIDWNGWIIHGDKHNNDLEYYPFFNGEKKTINVSAELINFTPIDLDKIIAYNLDSTKKVKSIDNISEPQSLFEKIISFFREK